MKHVFSILIILIFLAYTPLVQAQKETFEELFKTAMKALDGSDSLRTALFTAAIDHGISDTLDLENYHNAMVNRGIIYSENGDYKAAIADFKLAIHTKPDAHNVIQKLGTAYLQNGEYVKAIDSYDRYLSVMELQKENNMGSFTNASPGKADSFDLEMHEKVIAEYNEKLARGYNNRGVAKAHLQDSEGACADFRKAHNAGMTELKSFIEEICE